MKSRWVSEDELCGQFLSALEKVQYFGTAANGDDEQALQRATNLFHSAFADMEKSGCKEIDLTSLADTFKLHGIQHASSDIIPFMSQHGTDFFVMNLKELQENINCNKAVESKLYPGAIELYTVAIALRGDNAIYYCNRAAAYTRAGQHAEAIIDCQKAIAIDPKYIKAYCRLGYIYSAQGKYTEALEKGYGIGSGQRYEYRMREECGQVGNPYRVKYVISISGTIATLFVYALQNSNWSYSNGVMSVTDPVFGNMHAIGGPDTNPGELYMFIRAAYQCIGGVAPGDDDSNGN
ncbi:small glutamine-rich tetratricopeptide repeat-containing protein [Tanacetum coccineum]